MKALGYTTLAVGVLFLFSGYGAVFSFFMIPLGIVMLIRSEKAGTLEQLGYTILPIYILLLVLGYGPVVNFTFFLLGLLLDGRP